MLGINTIGFLSHAMVVLFASINNQDTQHYLCQLAGGNDIPFNRMGLDVYNGAESNSLGKISEKYAKVPCRFH